METIRFRLQTYEIKMETDGSKLVQIQSSTPKSLFSLIESHSPLTESAHVHQMYSATISLQNTFNIFLQSRERNLTLGFSKSKKASGSI